ncbi:hypothetical protein [Bradyrhizobium jicamae]|nr:hypothetical protein [Bradyrhizobium jicamae]
MKRLLRNRAVIALLVLALVLGALLVLSDDGLSRHFKYSFF